MPLHDKEIRQYLKSEFDHALFVDEVCVGDARVDLLDLSEELHGYEIKSDYDDYSRLPNQIKNYNRYLSKITIAVGYDKIYSIKSEVPDFWGIITVYKCPVGILRHDVLREPEPNPYFDKKYAITTLWKRELVSVIVKLFNVSKDSRYQKMRRWRLANILEKELSPKQSIQVIRACLLKRIKDGGWRDES